MTYVKYFSYSESGIVCFNVFRWEYLYLFNKYFTVGKVDNYKLHKIRDLAGRMAMAKETLNQYQLNAKNIRRPKQPLRIELPDEIYRYIYAVYGRRNKSKYILNLVLKDLNEEAGEQKGFF